MATWTEDLADCLSAMFDPGDLFDLERVYRLEPILGRLHPDNTLVRDKIRQQLQVLREEQMVAFLNDEGVYRWLGKRAAPVTASDAPRPEDFRAALAARFEAAAVEGEQHVDVTSGALHRAVGGYPGPSHRMPICCNVLHAAMQPGDEVIEGPPSGLGASLTIRYHLPRGGGQPDTPVGGAPGLISVRDRLVEVARRAETITYQPLADMLGLDLNLQGDRAQIGAMLGDISRREHEEGRPLLSVVVVTGATNMPGAGFFDLARRLGVHTSRDDVAFFAVHLRCVHDHWRQSSAR